MLVKFMRPLSTFCKIRGFDLHACKVAHSPKYEYFLSALPVSQVGCVEIPYKEALYTIQRMVSTTIITHCKTQSQVSSTEGNPEATTTV